MVGNAFCSSHFRTSFSCSARTSYECTRICNLSLTSTPPLQQLDPGLKPTSKIYFWSKRSLRFSYQPAKNHLQTESYWEEEAFSKSEGWKQYSISTCQSTGHLYKLGLNGKTKHTSYKVGKLCHLLAVPACMAWLSALSIDWLMWLITWMLIYWPQRICIRSTHFFNEIIHINTEYYTYFYSSLFIFCSISLYLNLSVERVPLWTEPGLGQTPQLCYF